MAVEIYEHVDSPKFSKDNRGWKADRNFFARGSYDENDIYAAILATFPLLWNGMLARTPQFQHEGGGFWTGAVVYESPEGLQGNGRGGAGQNQPPDSQPGQTDPLGAEFNFDTTGGTVHITQSIKTRSKTGRKINGVALPIPDNKKAIGASKDKVEGCDVHAPKLEFSLSIRVPFVTLKYVKDLVRCTGKVNSQVYLGFDAGELLFLGASGQYRQQDGWTIALKFAAAENESDIVIVGDEDHPETAELKVDFKLGWDYLWVGYRDGVDNNTELKQPDFAYVEQVYRMVDFAAFLGI